MNRKSLVALVWMGLAGVAARAQVPAETFATTAEGWQIDRTAAGCDATSAYDGGGRSILMIFIDADSAEVELAFSNPGWSLPTETAGGYRLSFRGGQDWPDLRVSTVSQGAQAAQAIVYIGFDREASVMILDEISRSEGVDLYRGTQLLDGLKLHGGATAVQRLVDCMRTFPNLDGPRTPVAAADGVARRI